MTVFKEYIAENTFLTDEQTDRVLRACITRRLQNRQHLLREGTVWKWHVFVMRGCLRIYYAGREDKELTAGFAVRGSWTGDPESTSTNKPSRFNIHALQDSDVVLIADTDFQALCRSIPGFRALAENILLNIFRERQKRIFTSLSCTADQKYAVFREDYPAVADCIPKHMIASYFGISSEYFSRSQTANRKG